MAEAAPLACACSTSRGELLLSVFGADLNAIQVQEQCCLVTALSESPGGCSPSWKALHFTLVAFPLRAGLGLLEAGGRLEESLAMGSGAERPGLLALPCCARGLCPESSLRASPC